ncbi:MAG: hypothetical protein IAC51_07415 [bacterium]|uniref:Uncharacterized protein n=1 Tax=Candidatus Aphodosoma intestinipullorum TaxID=2840674 RepID=A0A940IFB6_9BACT|nr:hypothetical protein [Candidatus Aphodosoma intestinipullorum]
MELKDFVGSVIEQISLGVLDAIEKCKKNEKIKGDVVIVNPNITQGAGGDFAIPAKPEQYSIQRRVQLIEMDVAIDSDGNVMREENTSESGVKVNENRVRFSIPVCLPATDVTKNDKK